MFIKKDQDTSFPRKSGPSHGLFVVVFYIIRINMISMSNVKKGKHPKVTHISKARLRFGSLRPATEPSYEVYAIWPIEVAEQARADIAGAEIRVDMRNGDPFNFVLRKVRYVLENAKTAFTEDAVREKAVVYMIGIVRDFGEPEGMEVLRLARALFGESPRVREAITEALARSGGESGLDDILSILKQDLSSPSGHLEAIAQFVQRHPGAAEKAIEALEPYAPSDPRFADAVCRIKGA